MPTPNGEAKDMTMWGLKPSVKTMSNFSPADGLLEISHDIQMTDEFHGSVFGKFHSNLHSRHLRRRIFRRSRSSPGGSWVSRSPCCALSHSRFRNFLVTPIWMKSQGSISSQVRVTDVVEIIGRFRSLPRLSARYHSGKSRSRHHREPPFS